LVTALDELGVWRGRQPRAENRIDRRRLGDRTCLVRHCRSSYRVLIVETQDNQPAS
jgi:hypothetical protein